MRLRSIAATLLLSASSIAFAGDIYVVGSVGRSSIDDLTQGDLDSSIRSVLTPVGGRVTSSSLDKNDTGFKLQLGYQFSPNLAIEGGYTDFGKLKYLAKTNGPDINVEGKFSAWTLSAVGLVPVNDKISVFGKVGAYQGKAKAQVSIANVNVSGDDSATRATVGIGVQYNLSNTLGLRAEYEHFDTLGNLLSAGVQAKF